MQHSNSRSDKPVTPGLFRIAAQLENNDSPGRRKMAPILTENEPALRQARSDRTHHIQQSAEQEMNVALTWAGMELWANSKIAGECREIAATLLETIQFIESRQTEGKTRPRPRRQ